jgi:hypothetical protein
MTGMAGAGLRQGRAAWAECERECGCAKWDGEASAGGAQKGARVRGRATWSGISTYVRECARAGPRWGAGKAELTGWSRSAVRERERVRRGNDSASGEAGP